MQAGAEKLAELRRSLATYELEGVRSVPLGHGEADLRLGGGLRLGALHEVFAGDAGHGAAAIGFAAGLAMRALGNKPLFWIREDFAALEQGELCAGGFLELGLDPKHLFMLRASDARDALRAAADILSCSSIGAVVIEISGMPKSLDLTMSRRLTLACAHKGVTAILLRLGATPQASAAETRWIVHAAASPPCDEDWGKPGFDVHLARNRHGTLGHWMMEWNCDDGFFRKTRQGEYAPHLGALAAASFDGSSAAPEGLRLAG